MVLSQRRQCVNWITEPEQSLDKTKRKRGERQKENMQRHGSETEVTWGELEVVQGDENDIINGEWLETKRNEKQPHMKISFWTINLSWRLWVIVGFYLYLFLPSISLSRYWICYNIASVVYVLGFWLQRHMGSSLPNQGSNSHPLHWKQSLNHWTTREVQRHCRLLNRGKDLLKSCTLNDLCHHDI